jgi:hypothetical protein
MVGLRDQQVDIGWSLQGARSARVPSGWLRDYTAISVRSDADSETASGQFWVPLPPRLGPYYIRIEAYGKDNSRLDYRETEPFL